jgi:4'-phosphopantetheinyl transferase EntD
MKRLFTPSVATCVLEAFDQAEALWPEEATEVATAVEKRVREFQAGRHCARSAMRALGIPATAIPRGADRAPIWPAGVVGTISHSDRRAGAAVARSTEFRGLGLDMELRGRAGPKLLRQIATNDELAHAQSAVGDDDALTLLFSAKEAFYKAQHPTSKTFLGFHDVRCWVLDQARYRIDLVADVVSLGQTSFEGSFVIDGSHVMTSLSIQQP